MKEFPRLKALAIVLAIVVMAIIVACLAALMWRAGWFDKPTSAERFARAARRASRAQAFSIAFNILIYAGTGAVVIALALSVYFMRSKVVNAATFVYAKAGLYPILRTSHRVQIEDGKGNTARFRRSILFDPNRALTPVTEISPEGARFTAHGNDVPATQLPIALGALTVQRQAAAAHDPGINLVDDDVATPDVIDHGAMPEVELDSEGHIQLLVEGATDGGKL